MDLLAPYILETDVANDLTDAEIDEQIESLTELATTPEKARTILASAYALILSAPSDERPQLLAATLLERSRVRDNMCDTWGALFDRFPHLNTALRYWIRWLNRDRRSDEAVAILQDLFEDQDQTEEDLAAQAELYSEIRDPMASDKLFDQLIRKFPKNIRIRVIYGKTLFARGDILRAFDILDPVRDQRLSSTAQAVMDRNDRAILAMETIRPHSAAARPTGPDALFNAVSLFHRRTCRPVDQTALGGITFYTGSLGAGGAERQLTQLAGSLHHRSRTGRNIDGTTLAGPVNVIVNSIDADRGKDFFHDKLKESGVRLTISQDLPKSDVSQLPERLEILEDLLPILPANSRFGLERLAAHLQAERPDVMYIWQDGAVLTGALAALVADVPRIAISLRGLPPNLRPHLMKPEYRKLYQALSDVPGVSFSCNSQRAALEYCKWLDLPGDRFSVLYNAHLPMTDQPTPDELARWRSFERQTVGATFTLGGVFRFTPNKRGLLWVDWAHQMLKQHPDARFVLVGDGDELEATQAKAQFLGIAGRILFVGRSSSPGYWYDKMDTVLLLSENEGLPNVLIEAQMLGKPVISTPAGGADETFVDGQTGFLLSSADAPKAAEFLGYIGQIVADPNRRTSMAKDATSIAGAKFSLEHILVQTIRHFHGQTILPAGADDTNVTQMQRRIAPTVTAPRVAQAYNIFANS